MLRSHPGDGCSCEEGFFSFKINKNSTNKSWKLYGENSKKSERERKLWLILMSLLLSSPFLWIPTLQPHPSHQFCREPEKKSKWTIALFFALWTRWKKGKTQVEKKAAKTESSGDEKQRKGKKQQRILISDYIDRIISQLYPLFLSLPFFCVGFLFYPLLSRS